MTLAQNKAVKGGALVAVIGVAVGAYFILKHPQAVVGTDTPRFNLCATNSRAVHIGKKPDIYGTTNDPYTCRDNMCAAGSTIRNSCCAGANASSYVQACVNWADANCGGC